MAKVGSIYFDVEARNKGFNKTLSNMRKMDRTSRVLSRSLAGLSVYFSAQALKRLVLFADGWGLLNDRVKAVSSSSAQATVSFRNLINISKETGSEVAGLINNFAKLELTREAVGGTTEEMEQLLDTLTKVGVIGGQNIGVVNSAILQFSQGLATGRFQAQEFQSVSEGLLGFAPMLAEKMGISIRELAKMRKDGLISSQAVFEATLKMQDEVNEKFKKMERRIGRSWNTFKLGAQEGVGALDKKLGITEKISRALEGAGEYMSNIAIYADALMRIKPKWLTMKLVQTGTVFDPNVQKGLKQIVSSLEKIRVGTSKVYKNSKEAIARDALVGYKSQIVLLKKRLDLLKSTKKIENQSMQSRFSMAVEEFKYPKADRISDTEDRIKVLNKKITEKEGELREKQVPPEPTYLEIIQQQKDKELAIEEEARVKKTQLDADAYMKDLWLADKHGKAMNRIKASFNRAEARYNAAYQKTKESGETDAAQTAIANAASHSKEMFAINKAMSLANLIVAIPEAVGQATAWGSKYGPAAAAASGGIVAAAMGVQMGALAATNYTAPRAVGGDVFPNSVYKVNENQPELFNFGGEEFLSTGSSRGNIDPSGGSSKGAVKPVVNVIITPTEGQTATVNETTDGNGESMIEVILRKVDEYQAQGISEGTSKVNKSMESVFGLNRAAGAFS